MRRLGACRGGYLRRCSLALVVALGATTLAGSGTAPITATAGGTDASCRRSGDRLQYESAAITVYYTDRGVRFDDAYAVYGCTKRTGRRFRIDRRPHLQRFDLFPSRKGPYVAAVSYDATEDEYDEEFASVYLVDLRDGQLFRIARHRVSSVSGYVGTMKVTDDGTAVYLKERSAEEQELVACELPRCYDSRGVAVRRRVLDRARIRRLSVELRGNRLRWVSGQEEKTATLE